MNIKNITILASGSGSNAEKLVLFFKNDPEINIQQILSNKKEAYVLQRAANMGIKHAYFSRKEYNNEAFLRNFKDTDLIVLAGFLWLIPEFLIKKFDKRIINIHPALLPSYGGKGMYGMNVHRAIISNNEKKSGITVHYVNENYDEGDTIFQAFCDIEKGDSPEDLANKIHKLEHEHFPKVVNQVVKDLSLR